MADHFCACNKCNASRAGIPEEYADVWAKAQVRGATADTDPAGEDET